MRRVWRAIPKSAQSALLVAVVLTVVLTVLWAASPLWVEPHQ